MNSKITETPSSQKESKINELKSASGIIFRAKLIGNIEVEELRGKTIAENAMAKLKFSSIKKRQHKTKINISLKWDGLYVHLSEGGQEMLYSFQLEKISYVWKDSTDDRAIGLIITESSTDKQSPVAKFYAYKTEKPAIHLITALKELFIFRSNDDQNHSEEQSKPQEPADSKTELDNKNEDLLDLNISPDQSDSFETFTTKNLCDNSTNKWSRFSDNDVQKDIPTPVVVPIQIPSMINYNSPWITYSKISNMTPNPFEVSWQMHSCNETISSNPFAQSTTADIPSRNANVFQHSIVAKVNLSESQTAKKQSKNLFSDLNPLKIPCDHSKEQENVTKKPSLVDLKNYQNQKETDMDFSIFDIDRRASVEKQKINPNSICTPLFQID